MILAISDYGILLSVGGKFTVLSVYLYRNIMGYHNFSKGAVIAAFLLFPTILLWIYELIGNKKERIVLEYNKVVFKNRFRDAACFSGSFLLALTIVVLIASYFLISVGNLYSAKFSFDLTHINLAISRGFFISLRNSLLIASISTIAGLFIIIATSYFTARMRNKKISKFIYSLSTLSIGVPGLVLGLGYMMSYSNTLIYNTILILIMVTVIHYFTTPFLTLYNILINIPKNYHSISMIFGISATKSFYKIILPYLREGLLSAGKYIFSQSLINITVITFLFNTNTLTAPILLNEFDKNMFYGSAAFISAIILIINIIVGFISDRLLNVNSFTTKERSIKKIYANIKKRQKNIT